MNQGRSFWDEIRQHPESRQHYLDEFGLVAFDAMQRRPDFIVSLVAALVMLRRAARRQPAGSGFTGELTPRRSPRDSMTNAGTSNRMPAHSGTCHNRTVSSLPADRSLPSGVRARALTGPVCP